MVVNVGLKDFFSRLRGGRKIFQKEWELRY